MRQNYKPVFMACALVLVWGCSAPLQPQPDAAAPSAESTDVSATNTGSPALRVADSALAGGDAKSAALLYQKAAEEHPTQIEPLLGLARSLSALGDSDAAIIVFDQTLTLERNNSEARRGLALAYLGKGQPALALPHLDVLKKSQPIDHRPHNLEGVAFDMMGRHAEAQDSYRTGLELAPTNVALRNNLGLSLALSGDVATAVEVLGAVAGEPDASARTRQNLALALGLAGDIDAAREIGALDLPDDDVATNLDYYEMIRQRLGLSHTAPR